MANIQVGKYVYNTQDLPFTAKVLNVLKNRKSGATVAAIAQEKEILADFNNDATRAQAKVNVAVSNLRFRSVVAGFEVAGSRFPAYRIVNNDEALTLIGEGAKIVERMTQRGADAANITTVSAGVSNSTTTKVKTMATKKAPKSPRLFLNPESKKVEAFGAGRPSKVKLACECNAEGKYLNPQAATAFIENGGKSEDKLTKAELLDLVKKLRAERDAAMAAIANLVNPQADSVDASDVSDDTDDLDLEAEAVDSDEDSMVEADEID